MKQVIVNRDPLIEYKDLYIILSEKASEEEHENIEQIKKQIELYELYKNFNPRYFEEGIPVKEAIEKHFTSDIVYSSKFNMFRNY